jgi:hypothetical protein
LAAVSLTVVAGTSLASETTPVYAGLAAGQAHLAADEDFGWAAVVGTRPMSMLGAEIQYVDFGHIDRSTSASPTDAQSVHTDAKARGVALFAVGYVPLPANNLDVYAKVGVSRIDSTVTLAYTPIPIDSCFVSPNALGCGSHVRDTNTHLAWGAGVQIPIAKLALRADYERFTAAADHPSLLSLGVTYAFR